MEYGSMYEWEILIRSPIKAKQRTSVPICNKNKIRCILPHAPDHPIMFYQLFLA